MTDIGLMVIVAVFVVLIFSTLVRKTRKQQDSKLDSHSTQNITNRKYHRGASDENDGDSDGGD